MSGMGRRGRMTENERLYFFCIMFPPMWIFLPFLIASSIADAFRAWREARRPAPNLCALNGHWWDVAPSQPFEDSEDHPGGPIGNDMIQIRGEQTFRTCRRCKLQDVFTTSERV